MSGLVIFVLLAGALGGAMAHDDPCEPRESEVSYSGIPEPLVGAPGEGGLAVGGLAFLRLEIEEPFWGSGEWRWEVVHEDLGVVVENHGSGVWAAGEVNSEDAVYEDEALDLPGGEYTIRFTLDGVFSDFEGTMTWARC